MSTTTEALQDRTFHVRCPKCGNEESFRVEVCVMANLYNSTDDMQTYTDADSDHEWDKHSHARCGADDCEWQGEVWELEEAYDQARTA
ncbi:MAG: hypothetical protein IT366_24480 [Candidatus Hydrogenedentes bacterium]|nr:hypothetical protein [Candidatus Hydrogenedentota bacterium]